MFAILSHSSDQDSAEQDVEFIKEQKDAFLLKIIESLKTRKSAAVQSEKRLRFCEFEYEVSR